jgi:hypothetical protein
LPGKIGLVDLWLFFASRDKDLQMDIIAEKEFLIPTTL